MNKKFKYGFVLTICLFFMLVLSGCGAGAATTYESNEAILKETQKNALVSELNNYVDLEKIELTDEEKDNYSTKLIASKSNLSTNLDYSKIEESLKVAYTELYNAIPTSQQASVEDVNLAVSKAMKNQLLQLREKSVELAKAFTIKKDITDREEHQEYLCDQVFTEYSELLLNAESANLAGTVENKVVETKDIYQLFKNYTVLITKYEMQEGPITFHADSVGDFFAHIFDNLIVFPIGWLMQFLSHIAGGYYIIGLLIATILVRTLGWPIYAKTNDMSLKMNIMQPELQKLEAKYANRPDPDSQRMKQMEQMQLYKKYKVGMGGCLMPLLQFPIFMGVYRAVSRMQYTDGTIPGTNDWVSDLNTKVFGVDLFETRGEFGTAQFWGIIVIVALVVGTQILSQIITTRRQKQQQAERQSNIPEYRRQAVAQNDTAKTMKYMMYFMIVMMGFFAWQSAAGLGVYWVIGNVYSIAQTYINNKLSTKRMEELKEQMKY